MPPETRRDTLDRLAKLTVEPTRQAMSRTRTWPSTKGRVLDLKLELNRTREALREALAMLEVDYAAMQKERHK